MSDGQVVLVRHGQTEWSLSGQHTGTTDIPLTEEGQDHARALGARLAGWDFARVLTSPLSRALETCRLAGLGDRAEIVDGLREWDYGASEGRRPWRVPQSSLSSQTCSNRRGFLRLRRAISDE